MQKTEKLIAMLPEESIGSKIIFIRGVKVMIDIDLAKLYKVKTKRLNEQVKRNIERFREDFMFQLTAEEKDKVVAFCDHLEMLKFSPVLPFAFTEKGIAMLSGVLNSDIAIQVHIQIIRTFAKLRELMATNELLRQKIEEVERKNNKRYASVFRQLKYLLTEEERRVQKPSKDEIGFQTKE